jgi:hypothetical protein
MRNITDIKEELGVSFRVHVTEEKFDHIITSNTNDSNISYGLTWTGDRPLEIATCHPSVQSQFAPDYYIPTQNPDVIFESLRS